MPARPGSGSDAAPLLHTRETLLQRRHCVLQRHDRCIRVLHAWARGNSCPETTLPRTPPTARPDAKMTNAAASCAHAGIGLATSQTPRDADGGPDHDSSPSRPSDSTRLGVIRKPSSASGGVHADNCSRVPAKVSSSSAHVRHAARAPQLHRVRLVRTRRRDSQRAPHYPRTEMI